MAITVGISLYSTRLILNALGVSDFGLYTLVAGAIAVFGFLNASMSAATQRFISYAQGAGNSEEVNKIFNMSILLHAGVALLAVIILEFIGFILFSYVFKIQESRIFIGQVVFQFMIIGAFFTILSVPYEAVITSHENMFFFAFLSVFEAIIKLGIAIYITYTSNDHLFYYALLIAILSFLLLLLRVFYCNKKYNECLININKNFDKKLLKEMTSFAGWSLLGYSSTMISFYGQGVVINMFFNTIVNAAQGLTNQISGQLGAFATTMMKTVNPIIDKSEGSGNRELMLKITLTSSKASFFLMTLFYIPFILEMPFILKIWLKEIPDYTIIFCQLLLMRNLIEQFSFPLWYAIAAQGNIRLYQIWVFFISFSPLLISALFFQLGFQPYVLYIINLIYSFVFLALTLFFAIKNCQLSFSVFLNEVFYRCIISFILIFIVALIPKLFLQEGVIRLFVVAIWSTILLMIALRFYGLTNEERLKIRELLNGEKFSFLKKIIKFV
jgi:O-antigen/teichoic acid export membrane protein